MNNNNDGGEKTITCIINNNNNNNEILFWKVIHNKILFNKIFHLIRTIEWFDYFNYGFNFWVHHYFAYGRFYGGQCERRNLFKNITSFNWMLEKDQIKLLYCKLKNNEYLQTDQNSILNLVSYFDRKIKGSSQSVSSSPEVVPLTNQTYNSLFKNIVSLIIKNNVIRNQDYKVLFGKYIKNVPLNDSRRILINEISNFINGLEDGEEYDDAEYRSRKRIKYDDHQSNEKPTLNSKLPISWHHLIPSMYFISNHGLVSILINDKETFDWILNNQNDLNNVKLEITFNSFKVAQYAISIVFTENKINPIISYYKIIIDYPSQNNSSNIIYEPSIFYQHTFLKSIYECNIKELEYMVENNISITWFIDNKIDHKNIESRSKFSDDIDLVKLNQLIDYLGSINYNFFEDFCGLLFVNFIIQLANKIISLLLSTESKESTKPTIFSILNKVQIPSHHYLQLLLNRVIDGSLSSLPLQSASVLVEFCINHHYNPIKECSQELSSKYNSASEKLKQPIIQKSEFYLDDYLYSIENKFSNNVDTIISMLELFANYFKNQNDQKSLSTCDSIIQYLYSKLITFSNVSINKLKSIYQVLVDIGIIIRQDKFNSFYYLLKKSPDFINYIIKITNGSLTFPEQINPSIFSFEFIFSSSYDEILDKLVHSLSSLPLSNSSLDNGIQLNGFYSFSALNENLEFYLSINRLDLFFKLLNLLHQKIQHNNKDENQILTEDYESSLRKLMISLRKKQVKKNIKYVGEIDNYIEYGRSIYILTKESLINGNCEDGYSVYPPFNANKLFSVPFYKFKDWKIQQQNDNVHKSKTNQFQSSSSYITGKEPPISIYYKEIEMYGKCNDDGLHCSNNNQSKEKLIDGRIFYPSKKIYYRAFKIMGFSDLMEFIKINSYRSFIHFLYSYGIEVKPLLLHYQLINHILLNHNHNYQNTGNIEENYQFLLNYWNTVFTFTQIMPKTLFDLQKFININVKPNSSILNRLMDIYSSKSVGNYMVKKQMQRDLKQCNTEDYEKNIEKLKDDEHFKEIEEEFENYYNQCIQETYFNQLEEYEENEIEYYVSQFQSENIDLNSDQLIQNNEFQHFNDNDNHQMFEIYSNNEMYDQLIEEQEIYYKQQDQLEQEHYKQEELINSFLTSIK